MSSHWQLPVLNVEEASLASNTLASTDERRRLAEALTGRTVDLGCLRPDKTTHAACNACPNCITYGALAFDVPAKGWGLAALNQLLLLCEQHPVSSAFYASFFPTDGRASDVVAGVVQFRTYAMLAFGSFQLAFNELAPAASTGEICRKLRGCGDDRSERESELANRPDWKGLVDEEHLPEDQRFYTGYLSGKDLTTDENMLAAMEHWLQAKPFPTGPEWEDPERLEVAKRLRAEFDTDPDAGRLRQEWTADRLAEMAGVLAHHRELRNNANRVAEKNTVAYLAARDIDVYVATSMREPWEYMSTAKHLKTIFEDPELRRLRISYFNPTIAGSPSRIDKGLLEGLVLERARATIYMVQETDTLGKDSELATTLAHGKPVIAFVPTYDVTKLAKEFETTQLDRTWKRMYMLIAAGKLNKTEVREGLMLHVDHWDPQFTYDKRYEKEFGTKHRAILEDLFRKVAEAEQQALDDRAKTLQQHPLALQLELSSGVAGGVLLARTEKHAAALLKACLLNQLNFRIETNRHGTNLVECSDPKTEATYRTVTSDPVLTNSFWSYFSRSKS